MKDIIYIKHDVNASQDPKIVKLKAKFGPAAYAMFWCALEAMRNEETLSLAVDDTDVIAYISGIDVASVTKMVDYAITIGLFNSNGKRFTSNRLIEDVNYMRSRRKNASDNGKKGGRPKLNESENKAKEKQNESKTKAKNNQVSIVSTEELSTEEEVLPPYPLKGESLQTENFDLPEKKQSPKKSTRGAAVRMAEYRTWLAELGFKEGPATDLVLEWLEYKTGRREGYASPKTLSVFIENLRKLSGGNFENAKTIVRTAIGNTSQGIYPLKNSNQNGNSKGTKVTNEDLASIILGDRFVPGDS